MSNLAKRQLCVQRSDWKGHVTVPKGGRLRYVPMTVRLAAALRDASALARARVLCQRDGSPLTRRRRQASRRTGRPTCAACSRAACIGCGTRSVRISRCEGRRRGRFRSSPGIRISTTTQRYMHLSPAAIDSAIRLLDRPGDPLRSWQHGGNADRPKRRTRFSRRDLVGGVDGTRTRGLCRDRAAF